MLSPDVQEVLQRQCLEAPAELGILQFDPLTEKMISWPWPLDSARGFLVPIHDLDRYRAKKQFHHPSCFCSTPENPVVESAFYIPSKGAYRGFWAVACAQDGGIGCSYFIPIERLYRRGQIPRQSYPSRTPAPVVRSTEPYAALLPAPLSPPNPQPGRIQQKVPLPIYAPPPNAPLDLWDIFGRLDDWLRPGVPLAQFQAQIAVCECGLVTTVRSFELHLCQGPVMHPEDDMQLDVKDEPVALEQQVLDWDSCEYDFESGQCD